MAKLRAGNGLACANKRGKSNKQTPIKISNGVRADMTVLMLVNCDILLLCQELLVFEDLAEVNSYFASVPPFCAQVNVCVLNISSSFLYFERTS